MARTTTREEALAAVLRCLDYQKKATSIMQEIVTKLPDKKEAYPILVAMRDQIDFMVAEIEPDIAVNRPGYHGIGNLAESERQAAG